MMTRPTHLLRETIADRMRAAGGYTRGFDVLRIGLAISVLVFHSFGSTYGSDWWIWGTKYRAFPSAILPMFFALSGFLVTGSLVRTPSLPAFVTLRLLRLVPALFVEVCLSALILGPIVTTAPLASYFEGDAFRSYWLNILGEIHYHLPGVFETNPLPGIVNVSLWTVPYELQCYLVLIVLAGLGIVRKSRTLLWLTVVIGIGAFAFEAYAVGFDRFVRPPGHLLVVCFLAGVALAVFREHVPVSRTLFVLAAISMMALLLRPETAFLAVLPAAYATVYLGLLSAPRIPVLMGGDYSYGVYLYAFPVQQGILWLLPGIGQHHWWWANALLAIPTSFGFAMLSWHCVEKPVLSRKKLVLTIVGHGEAALRRQLAFLAAKRRALQAGVAVPPPNL